MAYYLRRGLRDRVFHLWNEERRDKTEIARMLRLARSTVVKVLDAGPNWRLPSYPRYLDAHADRIRQLYRTHESIEEVRRQLEAGGMTVPYTTLLMFTRRLGLRRPPKSRHIPYGLTASRARKVMTVLRDVLATLEEQLDSDGADPGLRDA